MSKIGFISLGCPKNQVDGERMLALLQNAGHEIVDDLDGADAVIVNTCAFIEDAKQEAIETILDMASMREDGMIGKIIVTGCLPERYREELLRELPEADAVLGIGANGDIVSIIEQVLGGEESVERFPPKTDLPENGARVLTSPAHWAYLKIAEGCSNGCTYCAIPQIRGKFRSRQPQDILDEAARLAAGGVKELVLVAQDTARYGEDICGKPALAALLRELLKLDGIRWIRLLYCYPERINDELLELMASEEKILPYLDIPFQHADRSVLRAMGRPGSGEEYLALIEKIRQKIPEITLRTSLIAGFPGETEEAFEALAEFVKAARFDRLGCFAYSREEGTKAYDLPDQWDEQTKRDRAEIIEEQQGFITEEKAKEKIGKELPVLVEGYDGYTDSYTGRSPADAPEIDRCVYFTSKKDLSDGDLVTVRIFSCRDGDLLGEVCD